MAPLDDRLRGTLMLSVLFPAFPIVSQVTQVPLTVPAGNEAGLVTDFSRQRIVLLCSTLGSGSNTFEWDGALWIDRRPVNSPSGRTFFAVAADPARGGVMLYGGSSAGTHLQDTWSWDGRDWQLQNPAQNPGMRVHHAMAADTARQRVVLYGGLSLLSGFPAMADTWEWDGTNWSLRQPGVRPPPLLRHAMAFDPLRQRTVMFGGDAGTWFPDAVWEWDGQTWQQINAALSPGARGSHAMTWVPARQRVLLAGGADVTGRRLADAWEWDGTQWSAAAAMPVARVHLALACEAQGPAVMLFGGADTLFANQRHGDSYRWDGSAWQQVGNEPPSPRRRFAACTDLLRARTVFHGGTTSTLANLADTFEWDGDRWRRLTGGSPGQRIGAAMAFDLARGKPVLFGGSGAAGAGPETWELDGAVWTQVSVPGPPARANHAMAWHAPTSRIVLFGGSGTQLLGDTWTFDGVAWLQQPPGPAPRHSHAMAADPVRGRVVLFGGRSSVAELNDTWEWHGAYWTQATPPTSPPARSEHAITYDWNRQRVVLHGGNLPATSADLWQWDGSTWLAVSLAAGPPVRSHHLSYDIAGDRMLVLFGAGQGPEPGVAVLSTTPAAVSTLGTGCGGALGPPRLAADTPFLGNRWCALDLAGLVNAPCVFAFASATLSQPLGAGCTMLLAQPMTAVPGITNSSGVAQHVLAIALLPAMRGLAVYAQAGVLDASAPLGFGLTQGVQLVVGD